MHRRPRWGLVVRLTGMALTWGFLVVAQPAGAHEVTAPAEIRPVSSAFRGLRERAGAEARAEAVEARRDRVRARMVAKVKHARALARAKAKARALAKRRAALQRARERARFIATHRCPVDGPNRRWLRGDWQPQPFARPVDGAGAEKRGHFGIDLFAPSGTPVRAPFDGWLRFGRGPRAGLWFTLRGNGGYAYGAHMSRVGSRERYVRTSDIIGYVGTSGNARGTHPHLHFEWHPGGGRAVNPAAFLWSRCGSPSASYPS